MKNYIITYIFSDYSKKYFRAKVYECYPNTDRIIENKFYYDSTTDISKALKFTSKISVLRQFIILRDRLKNDRYIPDSLLIESI